MIGLVLILITSSLNYSLFIDMCLFSGTEGRHDREDVRLKTLTHKPVVASAQKGTCHKHYFRLIMR